MTRYLLDTNVVSEVRKLRPHGAVIAWLRHLSAAQTLISAVTLAELQKGVEITRRQAPERADELEHWVDALQSAYEVLPMDALCFREWARLMTGKSDRLTEDVMLAATARTHSLILATRNEADFRALRVEILNPFKYRES